MTDDRPRFERLSPLDVGNLRVEDRGVPMHVAALAVLDGAPLRDAAGRLRLAAIREHVARRTRRAPRLRQRLHRPPPGAGPPVWVDDPHFDISCHVRTRALPAPGDEATLLRTCAELDEPRLDRSRPLWEMWLLTDRDDGTIALLLRLHHVVADGIAALELFGALLDTAATTPDEDPGPVPTPVPPPSVRALVRDNLHRRPGAAWRWLRAVRPAVVARRAALRVRQLRSLARQGRAPRVSFDGPVGPHRRLSLVRCDLAEVRRVAHAHGATVNDVVLAAVAAGARRLLAARGELDPDLILKASVAASLRTADDRSPGNRVGILLVPLPVGPGSVAARVAAVARETARLKREPPLQPGGLLLQRWTVRVMRRQRLVNLFVSNLVGPPVPLYFAGARVRELFQVGVVQGNVGVAVGVLSYAGRLNVDVVADADLVPDVDEFAGGIVDGLAELGVAAVGGPPRR
ncbi:MULTISPECIES: wax ester/triacylglycerol synthase family O-acyltransferase [unclassified Rhodococcus (in: high G+C Gram-positive bacteria)]|uniref:wax ester/triacylglycerol synthase family O-acyltransferase n=1 Tax=unclassified Rhodococcus (in: high G+C Gram-positive bacteria) TaxID=192944 RepID=UPI000927E6BC|nr:wax ester/triacylglycerol synthase family O-acyltransferase [Rhodococcus sp. M8]OLL17718.1 acyltransferase [Rhodococcus sp. M8]QPG45989.1 wax ester/triacylglycerol synthase family O-acyltransferase [Rhodococcus sp. M8]